MTVEVIGLWKRLGDAGVRVTVHYQDGQWHFDATNGASLFWKPNPAPSFEEAITNARREALLNGWVTREQLQ